MSILKHFDCRYEIVSILAAIHSVLYLFGWYELLKGIHVLRWQRQRIIYCWRIKQDGTEISRGQMLHNHFRILIFIISNSSYLIVLRFHFLGESLVYFLGADIISILFQYVAIFGSEIPTLRDADILGYHVT
jgi:hypothetical protein